MASFTSRSGLPVRCTVLVTILSYCERNRSLVGRCQVVSGSWVGVVCEEQHEEGETVATEEPVGEGGGGGGGLFCRVATATQKTATKRF